MDFLNKDFRRLSFSPKVKEERKPLPVNPKRLQREIARQVNSIGTGTKSQQALQLQREQNKAVRQEKALTHGAAVNGGINNGRGSE